MSRIQVAGQTSSPLKIPKSAFVGAFISLGMHVVMLVALSFIVFKSPLDQLQMIVDSVFTEERMQEEFTQEVEDHGYGLVTYFRVPGEFKVQLYQPKYTK